MGDRGDADGGPRLRAFRAAVKREFGPNLERATPANVREFMDRYQEDLFVQEMRGRIELNETKTTFEDILKDFFVSVLDHPTEDALITLWILAFETTFANIEQHVSERLQTLFGDWQDHGS